ncbi:MAG TPA: hypothetical protein VEI97_03180 [bacterium]|nr:hypothetical protein [bacterium]
MAAFQGSATTAEIALSAATAKTIIQLVAASNHRVKLLSWGVYFDGTSTTAEPVQVRLLRQTTAGTMTSLTPVKRDDSIGETLQTTAQHTATAEPTAGDVLEVKEVHPQMGYEKIYPFGGEVIIGGGDRLGIEVTAPAVVNVRAEMAFEE